MNQEARLDLMCHIHKEKIVSVKMPEKGDPQMYCQKCLTPDQISIEQLSYQLTDLRSKKNKKIIELEAESEKRFLTLRKLFSNIKDMLNQQIDEIMKNVDNIIKETKQTLKKQTEALKKPINQLSITQVVEHLKELKEEVIINDQEQYDQMKTKMIEQFIKVIKSIQGELEQSSQYDQFSSQEKEEQQNQQLIGQYQLINEKNLDCCYQIEFDQVERTLVTCEKNGIRIWDIESNGSISLKHSFNPDCQFCCICFSKNLNWFVSSENDGTMGIWQQFGNEWKCKQKIKIKCDVFAYKIAMLYDDQEFLSCHSDNYVRFWMKNLDQWECYQTLYQCNQQRQFIRNKSCIIEIKLDYMILWSKGVDQKWNQKIQLYGDFHSACFISNNELIAKSQHIGKLRIFLINDQGTLQLQQTFPIDENEDENEGENTYKNTNEKDRGFPIIFNQQLNLIIFWHFPFTYIMRRNKNSEFKIFYKIYGNHNIQYMFKNSLTFIMAKKSDSSTFIPEKYDLIQIYSLQKNQQREEINELIQEYKAFDRLAITAIMMDKNEKIIIQNKNCDILIWERKTNGSITLQHTLVGHNDMVKCICLSRNDYWLISSQEIRAMRIWELKQGNWICEQIIDCGANQIFITKDDKQFISSSESYIRIWMKQKKWECYQELSARPDLFKFMTLSLNEQYLISSQAKNLIFWSKVNNPKWNYICKFDGDYRRICFISNNELIAISEMIGKFMRYYVNNNGLLQLKQTIEFDKYYGDKKLDFPIIFNQQYNLILFRHSLYTYIMKKQKNGDFEIHSKIYGKFTAGYLFNDGQKLILCDEKKKIQVLKIK